MDIQRLRNLTTGRLHTEMRHIYEDIEYLTGHAGIMTHMLPRAARALEPYLRSVLPDERFWDGKHDPTHIGTVDIEPMDEMCLDGFWERYSAQPDPLKGKDVMVVIVQ